MYGKFITFEGGDGSGKTTACAFVAKVLTELGHEVVRTREPGGTPVGEQLRALHLAGDLNPTTELLLLAAGRAEHISKVIVPALHQGKIVLCDRFTDSTYAYQGAGRGLAESVETLEELVCGNFKPDHTLYFDVSLEESERRLRERLNAGGETNHLDEESLAFKKRVFAGYELRYRMNQDRMHRIAAECELREVEAQLLDWLHHTFIPTIGKTQLKVVK